MAAVPLWRLHALRVLYAILVVGLGLVIWPSLIAPAAGEPRAGTVVYAMLGALAVLAAFGIRYPLRLLPLLLFELLWKVVWSLAIALPAWQRGHLGSYGLATFYECLPALVIFPLVLPWRYIFEQYLRAPGEAWRRGERVRGAA